MISNIIKSHGKKWHSCIHQSLLKRKDADVLMYQSIYTNSCSIMNMSSCNILHKVWSNKTELTGRQSLETKWILNLHTLPMLHLLFWKNLFCVLLRRSGPPAIARIIASAILFSNIQISTAASKFPVSKDWLKSPSASEVHRYNNHHKIISVHVYKENNN